MSKDLLGNMEQSLADGSNTFFVEVEFVDSILGGNPMNPTVFRTHIESKLRREAKAAEKKGAVPPTEERIQEIVSRRMVEMFGSDVETTIDAQEQKSRTTFKTNEFGPYIETRQVKAMLREMMSTLGITVAKKGSKQTLQHLVVVKACDETGEAFDSDMVNHINFERDGDFVEAVDDYVEMCAHVMGALGPRSLIKQHDRIYGAKIRFLIQAPANLPKPRSTAVLRDEEIQRMLAHAQSDGLGACRSQGYGKVKVVKLERLTNVRWLVGEDAPDSKKKKKDSEAA